MKNVKYATRQLNTSPWHRQIGPNDLPATEARPAHGSK